MEKLGQLRVQTDPATGKPLWDLIVVDTPPSRSALDFLDAPQRLGSFLDSRFLRLLSAPAKVGGRAYVKVLSAVTGGLNGIMNRVLGAQMLTDVQSFVSALDSMFGGFRQRADQTYAMLAGPQTAFLVVAAPEADAVREATYFVERLRAENMPLAGLVVNRVTASTIDRLSAVEAARAAAAADSPAREILQIHARRMYRRDSEARVMARLSRLHPPVPAAVIAARPIDVTDLDGLRSVAADLARAEPLPSAPAVA